MTVRGYVLTHSVFDILACVRRCLLPAHSSSPSELTFVMYTSSSNLVQNSSQKPKMDVEVRNATAAADAAAWSQKKRARDDAVMFTLQDPTSTFVVPEPTVPELQMDTSYVQDMQEATPPEPVALPVTLAAIQAPNNREDDMVLVNKKQLYNGLIAAVSAFATSLSMPDSAELIRDVNKVLSARAEGRSPFPSGSAAAEGKKEKPKRPPTAYNTYIKTVQEQVKAQNPGMKQSELMKVIATQWKDSDEKKASDAHRAEQEAARAAAKKPKRKAPLSAVVGVAKEEEVAETASLGEEDDIDV